MALGGAVADSLNDLVSVVWRWFGRLHATFVNGVVAICVPGYHVRAACGGRIAPAPDRSIARVYEREPACVVLYVPPRASCVVSATHSTEQTKVHRAPTLLHHETAWLTANGTIAFRRTVVLPLSPLPTGCHPPTGRAVEYGSVGFLVLLDACRGGERSPIFGSAQRPQQMWVYILGVAVWRVRAVRTG